MGMGTRAPGLGVVCASWKAALAEGSRPGGRPRGPSEPSAGDGDLILSLGCPLWENESEAMPSSAQNAPVAL